MTALVDAAARERIERDLDVSMCVEAGAGTGKTTMLVKRIVALIRTGRATIDDLAVITFTEKAAAELSARVRFELEAAALETTDDEERVRFDKALQGLYRARVQTIHAFAGDLLRERPIEARIDPGYVVMEELAASLDFDTAYREWLDELLARSRPEVEIATRRGFELAHLRRTAEIVHQFRHVLPLNTPAPSTPDMSGYREWAREAKAVLDECGSTCTDEDDRAFKQLARVAAFIDFVEEADEAELERLVLFEVPWVRPGLGARGNWSPGDNCDRVKDVYRELLERSGDLKDALRTEALCGVLGHVEEFVAGYAERRRREGVADFQDLLIWARDLVRENLAVRDHFRNRSTHILVDEFQDTDPIQAELITWLSGPSGASGNWREVTPEPGRLFVVGDPKQSIYRFRGADIAAYDAVKHGPLADRLEQLEQNFRSTESVLDWVNVLFDQVFVEQPGVQPANTHLYARETELDGKLDRSAVVTVHSLDEASNGGLKAEELREEESSLLARTIWRAVEEEHWPVRNRRNESVVRPVQWRDVAILTASRTKVELLEAALVRHGVPYRLEGGRGFYARQEVRDLISLLEAIDDPTDSIAIVAALRSLAFGCSDDDLLLWRVENERFDYRWIPETGPDSVRESLKTLSDLHRAQRSLSLGDLVQLAVQRSGLVEAALTVPGGDQAAANVLKVVDIAQEFAGAGGGALRAFSNWLARNRDEGEREVDAPVAEERDDVVRVMTVHAAKGLEFPVVCMANAEWKGPTWYDPIPDAVNQCIHFSVGNLEWARFATPDYDDEKETEKTALEAERDRLLYVALTRARDHLILPVCREPAAAKGFMGKMSLAIETLDPDRWGLDVGRVWQYDTRVLDSVGEHPPKIVSVDPGTPADEGAVELRDQLLGQRDASVRDAARGIELVIASSVKSASRPLIAESDAAGGGGDEAPPTIDTGDAPPLELGDAFHRVMELVDFPALTTLEPLGKAICEEHGIPESANAVIAMARLACGALEREGIKATGAHSEVPFVVPNDHHVLVGRIDLVSRAPSELQVVDFKTDERRGLMLVDTFAMHHGQAETYREAVKVTADNPVVSVYVVYARTGEVATLSSSRSS